MKRTRVTDLIANIKGTFVSFFSILMFAALGVGMFLGISWASPALENAADSLYNEGSFHHYQIQFPYGLTEDDIGMLSQTEGVAQVEAERQSFQTIRDGNHKYTVKVQSLGQEIDTPIIVEGKLPASVHEIAIHEESAKQLGISVGDTITFEKDAEEGGDGAEGGNGSGMQYLLGNSFKVTAIVNSADYVANAPATYGFSMTPSGSVDALAWVADDAFDASAFFNGYPIVNVRCDGLEGMNTFSNDYKQASASAKEPIDALGSMLAPARYDDLYGKAQKEINEGQAKLDEAESKLAQGEKDIAEGEKKLEDGRSELQKKSSEGQAKLDEAYAQLMEGEAQIADGRRRLDGGYARVDAAQQEIDEADASIAEVEAEVDDAEGYKAQCDADLADGTITQEEYNRLLDERGAQADARIQPIARQYDIDVPNITHENYEDALFVARLAISRSEELPVVIDGEEITLGEARQRLETAKSELAAAQAEFNEKVAEINDASAPVGCRDLAATRDGPLHASGEKRPVDVSRAAPSGCGPHGCRPSRAT